MDEVTSAQHAPWRVRGCRRQRLWERNSNLDIESCTIIATQPNELLAEIHNRMLVILAEDDWDKWLQEPREDLFKPAPEDDLTAYPVRSDIDDDDPPESLKEGEVGAQQPK